MDIVSMATMPLSRLATMRVTAMVGIRRRPGLAASAASAARIRWVEESRPGQPL
jgi:hypothetical protein